MIEERFAVGTVEGTGAAINVKCGFVPRYVKLLNIDSANEEVLEWFSPMGAGYGRKTSNDVSSVISTGGITAYQGADEQDGGQGFTIGTDADVNASAETLVWLAIR